MENRIQIDSPVGPLTLAEENGAITKLLFEPCEHSGERTALLNEAVRQLEEYFSGRRRGFELPLNPAGTPFQKKVWKALGDIPYGETRSYGEIARAIDIPKAFRAVGMANHSNPVSIIIPCHRVIGSDGSLTGYGGGLDKKIYLLQLEGIDIRGQENDGMPKIKAEEIISSAIWMGTQLTLPASSAHPEYARPSTSTDGRPGFRYR